MPVKPDRGVCYRIINGIHIDAGTPRDLIRANEWHMGENKDADNTHPTQVEQGRTKRSIQ